MPRSLRVWALLLAAFFGLGPTLSGVAPWTVERVALASTSDFTIYTAPTWARQCLVRNAHASADLFVGRYSESGAFNSSTSEYVTLPAGAAITIPLSAGTSTEPSDHLTIPLASSTSSHPAEFYCTSAP